MLPFHPVFHHTAEIAWPQNLYYGAEGKDIDEKLRFICGIIVNGAQPVFAFFMVFRMLFVAGKVKHTAFKEFRSPVIFKRTGSFALPDREKAVAGESLYIAVRKEVRGNAAVTDPFQVENGI